MLAAMEGVPKLMAGLLYGSGLRLMEACRLRVKDIDFERQQLLIRDGKGRKDRQALLPASLRDPLREQLSAAQRQHKADVAAGAGWVELPDALARKYPSDARSWPWQWVFPATRTYRHAESNQRRRHHLHQTLLQEAVAVAVRGAELPKRASCQSTLRRSPKPDADATCTGARPRFLPGSRTPDPADLVISDAPGCIGANNRSSSPRDGGFTCPSASSPPSSPMPAPLPWADGSRQIHSVPLSAAARSALVAESLRRSSVRVAPGPVALPSPPAAPGARVEPSQPRWPGLRRAQDQVAPAHCPPSVSRTRNCCRRGRRSAVLAAEFRRSAGRGRRRRWRFATASWRTLRCHLPQLASAFPRMNSLRERSPRSRSSSRSSLGVSITCTGTDRRSVGLGPGGMAVGSGSPKAASQAASNRALSSGINR